MNILVVTGSPRKGGNTEILADAFAQAAKESGHEVAVRKLSRLKVGPCLACEYCFTHGGVCVQDDAMNEILQDVHKADMLVLASPIYWFDISAQMKCFIDRVYNAAQAQLKDICDYLNWENKGAFTAPGMVEKGSIYQSAALAQVRTFAENL